ncbi:MAG: hypothetical protein ACI4K5_07180 [Ruminococcus sp.]
MKNLFGVDITDNEENFHQDGEIFITKRIPSELEQRFDIASEQDTGFEKSANFPMWLIIIKYIFIIGAVSFTLGIFQGDINFAEGYKNAPWVYWITPVLWIVSIVLIVFERSKAKKIYSSQDFSEHVENIISIIQEAEQYLEIPENAFEIDTMLFRYIEKNGEIKRKDFPLFSHMNFSHKAYIENNNLCLSNLRYVMEIPLQSIKSVHMEKKKASFPEWHKREPFNSKEYKQFKVTCNNQGTYFAKYYSVQIEDISGNFEFYVPNYDIDKICSLTGLNTDEK